MKSFALFCFLLLASACVFARAEEETAVEEPKTEDQPEVAADEADEAEEPEEESDEVEENDEEDDEEKRTYYKPICKPICHLVCKKKACARRVCKRVHCGNNKVCKRQTNYRIVKYKVKLPYSYDYYGPKYVIKVKKVPYTVQRCHLVPKYCTKCHTVSYICGKTCHKVCKQGKCYNAYY